MKRIVGILFFILIGCNDIPPQWVGPYLKKEASLRHLMRTNITTSDDYVETPFLLTMYCFVDTNTLVIDSCILLPEFDIHSSEYPAFLKVQIKSSEDTAWNSVLSYFSFKHSDKNLGWMVQPKGYYEGSEFIPSDTILIGDKFIPQKSLGVFEFEIRDSFGNRIKIGLDFHSRLPQVFKNSMGNLVLHLNDSLRFKLCPVILCSTMYGCDDSLRVRVDSSQRELYLWNVYCLSRYESYEIAIPDSSYLEKFGNYVAEAIIDLPEITVETDCKKGMCVEDDIRRIFEPYYYIYYK